MLNGKFSDRLKHMLHAYNVLSGYSYSSKIMNIDEICTHVSLSNGIITWNTYTGSYMYRTWRGRDMHGIVFLCFSFSCAHTFLFVQLVSEKQES